MRRTITIGFAAALAALVLPGAAMAHHSSQHARAHHHRRRHRAHTVVFSPATVRHTTPTPPSGETPPPGPGGEAAGTIASFEGGVLQITLSDGTTVSGKVTEQTRIQCGCPGHDGSWGGDGEDRSWGGDGGFSGSQGDDEHGSMPGGEETPSCGTAALVAGAKVHEAELTIGSSGAVWEKVDLAWTGDAVSAIRPASADRRNFGVH